MKQVFHQIAQLSTSGTYYIAPQGGYMLDGNVSVGYHRLQATESMATIFAGGEGTLRNLYVNLQAAPGAGNSYIFTVRKNGSDTIMVATIANTETSGSAGSNSVVIAAGDKISIKVEVTGTPAGGTPARISLESELNTEKLYTISGGTRAFDTTTGYASFGTYNSVNETSLDAGRDFVTPPHNCTLKALYVIAETAPGEGSTRSLRLYSAGSLVATVDISDTNTEASSTGLSLSYTPESILGIRVVEVSGPAESRIRYTAVFESDIDGESWMPVGVVATVADGFIPFVGATMNPQAAEYRPVSGPTGIALRKMFVRGDVFGAGDDANITIYKNGEATPLTVNVPAGESTGSNVVNEVVMSEGDGFNLYIDGTGASLPDGMVISIVQFINPGEPKGLPILFAG